MSAQRCSRLALLVLLVSTVWPGAEARADDVASVRFGMGLSGTVELNDTKDDLDPTLGGDFNYERSLHENLSLGAGLAVWSWISEPANNNDLERNLLFDAVLRPEGNLKLNGRVRLFAAVPIGLTYSTIGDDDFFGGHIDPAFGYRLGFEFGARFGVGRTSGVEVSGALVHHSVEHNLDTLIGSTSVDGSLTQFMINVGGYFELGAAR